MYCVPSRSFSTTEALMAYTLKRRRKAPTPSKPETPSKFTEKLLAQMAKDVQSGAIPLSKKQQWINLGDDRQSGLRAIIRKSGAVTFHAMYNIGDSRPMITVGQFPETTIEEARHMTRVVRELADHGVDVQEGLHSRLLKELAAQGTAWRPYAHVDKVIQSLKAKGVRIPADVAEKVKKELG